MGTRYIELFKSTTAEVQQEHMDPRNPEPQESPVALPPLIAQLPPQTALPYIPQSLITSGTKRDCIRLRNLPGGSQVTDILSFLGEFSQLIVYQRVHMVYSAQDMNLVLTHGITSPTLSPVTPIAHEVDVPTKTHSPIIQRQIISPEVTTNPLATSFSSALPLTHIPQQMYASTLQQGITPIAAAAPRPAMFQQIIYTSCFTTDFTTNTGPFMVVMWGLPFNVSLQDILNFFQGFPEVCLCSK